MPCSESGAEEQLARAATGLDRLLLAPIAPLIGSRPVVVVPTGELHATPWAALPTLAGRPVSVAPSARLWLAAARARQVATRSRTARPHGRGGRAGPSSSPARG